MNKHNLGIISVLVGIALIGLIAVQIYWIKSSVTLKEEDFERHVNEALKTTSYVLEKIATTNYRLSSFNKVAVRIFFINK